MSSIMPRTETQGDLDSSLMSLN